MANKYTESDVVRALFAKYSPLGKINAYGYPVVQKYVCASHVRSDAGWDSKRTADFIAFDTFNTGGKGLAFHGHEIKCSRSDWLTELKDTSKAQEFIQHCDYWYLVVTDSAIVKEGELPENWGLLIFEDGKITTKKKAPRITPVPERRYSYPYGQKHPAVHRGFLTSFFRRVQEQAYEKGLEDGKKEEKCLDAS